MHKIPFPQLQRATEADEELPTHSEAREAEMELTIAALEEWCLLMYERGSPVRVDTLRCMVVVVFGDCERRNIESAPESFNQIMDPDLLIPRTVQLQYKAM